MIKKYSDNSNTLGVGGLLVGGVPEDEIEEELENIMKNNEFASANKRDVNKNATDNTNQTQQ